ncbi:UDP-N-acetylmuramoyl-tripeptide--D-alanyl-D-alanine ligase [candidate division KSB1 bacterium]|nr:UDP-N-acetylmuramoyl-tripeptide--D-alanyl-D-alanine ligase [candidate division KSB1 bacterium]
MNFTIDDILGIPLLNAGFRGPDEATQAPIRKFVIDSRKIAPGDVFIAIRGERFDGHEFLPQIFENGAAAAVVDRHWSENNSVHGACIIVDDTLFALQEVAHTYRRKLSIPVIALTGSNGKTTTKEMIGAVLSQKWDILKTQGNLNNHVGVPLTLLELNDAHEIAVIEMGTNHFGEIKRLAEIAEPTHGLITNIGPAHLEFFGSLEGVAKAKTELWDFLRTHDRKIFVNIDDPLLEANMAAPGDYVTFGFESDADIGAEYLGSNPMGCPKIRMKQTDIQLQIPGLHNIHNALAASAIGLEFGLCMDDIRNALEQFKPTSKRMEVVNVRGITVINDCYNANLASVKKALHTLKEMKTSGKRIAVLADMLELGDSSQAHHRAVGEYAAAMAIDALYAFGPESKQTADAATAAGISNVNHYDDKSGLIKDVKNHVTAGDIVLIKGSRGMAMEEVTQALLE